MTKLIRNNLSVFFIIGLGLCFLFPTLSLAQTETTKEVTTADGNKSTQVSQGKKVVRYQSEDGKTYWTDFGALVASSSGVVETKEQQAFTWQDLLQNTLYYGGVGAATGAATGALVGGVGAAPGALVGAGVGLATGAAEYIFFRPDIKVTKWTDAAGNTFTFEVENSGDIVYARSDSTSENWRGCEVLPAKLYRYRDCMFCPLFTVIYLAADNITTISLNKLSAPFATIIALGLAIYIAFQTLMHVSSLTKQDAPKFLDTLIRQSFKFLIAFFLLYFHSQIFSYIINPILSSGITLGLKLTMIESNAFCATTPLEPHSFNYWTQDLYAQLMCFITTMQKEIAFMQAIGSSLLCIGGNMMITTSLSDFGDGFQMSVVGFLLALFGFLLSIAFAFYLVDAVVQLGIFGALLPFLIASWPFKITSKYANKGFEMLLNTMFVFVFMGLVLSINLELIGSALSEVSPIDTAELQEINPNFNPDALTSQGLKLTDSEKYNVQDETIVNLGGFTKFYMAINSSNEAKLKEMTDISGIDFLILIFCCIFGFKFVNQTSSLAKEFSGGVVSGKMAPSIATMGTSAALNTAKSATRPIRNATQQKAERAVNTGYHVIKSIPGRIRSVFRKGKTPEQNVSVINQQSLPTSATSRTPASFGGGNIATSAQTQKSYRNLSRKDRRKADESFRNEFNRAGLFAQEENLAQAENSVAAKQEIGRIKQKSQDAFVQARREGKTIEEATQAATQIKSESGSYEEIKTRGEERIAKKLEATRKNKDNSRQGKVKPSGGSKKRNQNMANRNRTLKDIRKGRK